MCLGTSLGLRGWGQLRQAPGQELNWGLAQWAWRHVKGTEDRAPDLGRQRTGGGRLEAESHRGVRQGIRQQERRLRGQCDDDR